MPRPRLAAALTATALTVTSLAGGGILAGSAASPAFAATSATDPDFGPNVTVFDPSQSVDAINATLASYADEAEFSTNRHAVLFKPGTYGSAAGAADPSTATGIVNAEIGYYTTVAGLGASPDDVTVNGALHVEAVQSGNPPWENQSPGSLTRFWRSMSNLAINPIQRPVGVDATRANPEGVAEPHQLRWAVSQAAPLRRVDVQGSLTVFGRFGGYASGGYMADSRVAGTMVNGSQQQWFTRDSSIGSWDGAVWNQVFSGVQGAPTASYPADGYNTANTSPFTVLPTTSATRGAPYLTIDGSGAYAVVVPDARQNASGPDWSGGRRIPLSDFYLAHPGDSAATINAALDAGENLLVTPGVYSLESPIHVSHADTVVLGMGMATLSPTAGTAAITTDDVTGVQLSGITIDAGANRSDVLVQVGPRGATAADASDPATLTDVFVRVGGPHVGEVGTAIEVNSPRTILDDIWAWRADHGTGVGWDQNTADTGVVVNGADVTATGLFVEHFQKNQTVWNGERGTTVFYQSELPYDPPSQAAWMDGSSNGYASYRVADGVQTHTASGMGIYSFFPDSQVTASRAVQTPTGSGIRLTHVMTRFLNGNGGIDRVVNDSGLPVSSAAGQMNAYLNSAP